MPVMKPGSFCPATAGSSPPLCEVLAQHLEECLTFYRFPERHWKHIRTSNVIERSFKEVKRRTRVVGRFPNETSALALVFNLLEEERIKWQKGGMRSEDIAWIEEASRALEQELIRLEFLEEALVAWRWYVVVQWICHLNCSVILSPPVFMYYHSSSPGMIWSRFVT